MPTKLTQKSEDNNISGKSEVNLIENTGKPDIQVYIDVLKAEENSIFIKGFVETPYLCDYLSVNVKNHLNNENFLCEKINTETENNYTSELLNRYYFQVNIPVTSSQLYFDFFITTEESHDEIYDLEIHFTQNSIINEEFNKITVNDYILSFKNNSFKVYPRKYRFSIIILSLHFKFLENQLKAIFHHENTENIQVIIVNNEYEDYARDIALTYKKQYPDNIFFIESYESDNNKLLSQGLKYATGKHIRILENDENISNYELGHVKELLNDNKYGEIIHLTQDDAEDIIYINKELLEKIMLDNPQVNIKNHILVNIKNNNLPDCYDEVTVKMDELLRMVSCYDNNKAIENSIIEEMKYILDNINPETLSEEKFTVLRDNLNIIYSNMDKDRLTEKISKDNNIILHYILNNREYSVIENDDETLLKTGSYMVENLSQTGITVDSIYVKSDNLYLEGQYSYHLLDELEINIIKEENNIKTRIPCKYNIILSDIQKTMEFEGIVPLKRNINTKIYFEITLRNNITYNPFINYKDSNQGEYENYIEDYYYISKGDECLNISRGYNFSIVIAVYNTENYLKQTLDSVVNQTIGFEDNVQLILVDDGSIDSSGYICREYKQQYPDNIIFIEQENSGQATARNNGLKYVKGNYVNFLDSDDYLEENALETVYPFFKSHENEIDIVAIPIKFFGRKEDFHMLNDKFQQTRVIDLLKEPNYPQLSSSSAFIKNFLFRYYAFPTNVISSEDTIILNKILFRTKKYGLVKDTYYYYRKRFDETSTIDLVSKQKEFFTDKLKYYFIELINFSLEKEKEVLPFIQYLIAYDIQWMLKEPDISILDEEEQEEFFGYLRKILSYIDDACIKDNKFVTNPIFKSYFMKAKYGDKHFELKKSNVFMKSFDYKIDDLENHKLLLDIVEIRDDTLYISGYLYSHFDINEISICAEKETNGNLSYYKGKYVKYTSRENVTFLSEEWHYTHSFDIQVPLNIKEKSNIKLVATFHKDKNKNNYARNNIISCYLTVGFEKHAKISDISNYIVKDDYILFFEGNTFKIEEYSYRLMKKYERSVQKKILRIKIHNYKEAIKIRSKYLKLYPLIRFYKRNHQIHIYMDRLNAADDNSEHLFRYASRQRDNVRKYYVLSKDSHDFNRVSEYGKVVEYKSEKNKFLYLLADKVISTHPYESDINPFFSYDYTCDERKNYSGLINSKIYFLQHGVTKDNISDWMSKYDKNLSLIVTVSDLERESFNVEGYGYDYNIIQTLGFPRYDNLKNNPGKQILIIPTWRKYLRGNRNRFINSDYFKRLNGLLNNEKFIESAKFNGYKIIFKAHPELEKPINDTDELYIDLFDINENIKLSTQESYQELLNNSSLLITDYSSVFFDFAYQKKPVIYYHPADDYHYPDGYFDYETMGFGEIADNEEALIENMTEYLDNDCRMKDKYLERVNSFFKYTDKNNSKRVYEWIKED